MIKLLNFFKRKERKETGETNLKEQKKAPRKKPDFHIGSRFEKKKSTEKYRVTKGLQDFLLKAGIDKNPREAHKKIIIFDLILLVSLIFLLIIAGIVLSTPISRIFTLIFIFLTFLAAAIYMLSLLVVFVYLDYKIYSRTKQVEEVLPDFLQLTAANIGAGMPIDKALWLAVRPRFGVLAKEIEEIAKATIAGEDLEKALINFSNKYDSKILKESINLLIAGLEAGGEIAELLSKISINIQETKLMQKEIAANVMTYVIFIAVATIGAAPFLFALSFQLLETTQAITSNVQMDDSGGSSAMFSFNFSGEGISLDNFTNFALLMIVISSIFSVFIISVIRKGSVKEGFKLIPVFIGVSVLIFLVSKILFSSLLGGFF